MNGEIIDALDRLITLESGSTSFESDDIPEILRETKFINRSIRPPEVCPLVDECREYCDCEVLDESLDIVCDADHEGTIPVEDYTFFDIDFEIVVRSIIERLGYETETISSEAKPRYLTAHTTNGFDVHLIISPSDYEKTINEICMETLIEDRPALLITPENTIDELLEIQSLFAAGNLIYTVPFTMMSATDEIRQSLSTIDQIQEVEKRAIQQNLDEQHPVVHRVNSNPRYILTELNQMRLLRLSGELPQSSGTRLEKVGESIFSHLFAAHPEAGGEDDRGSKLPDTIFYISDQSLPSSHDSILGIVDTKSGKNASFRSETVEGKHDEYLKRGRRQSVPAKQLAHTFVVLGFDGQQEIDFFDEMDKHYREDEYMVIITVEALATIMAAYLSHTVANELTLVKGDFKTAIYPFFHREKFRDAGLADITREVGQSQDEYDSMYLQRDGLLIITSEVVKQRLQDCMESPSEIENLLSTYYHPMPTI